MPTIHMEVEQVKAVLELMKRDEVEIRDTLKKLNNDVKAIVGTEWVGLAETEFNKEYTNLDGQLGKQVNDLEMLAERLRLEVAEWESIAANLA